MWCVYIGTFGVPFHTNINLTLSSSILSVCHYWYLLTVTSLSARAVFTVTPGWVVLVPYSFRPPEKKAAKTPMFKIMCADQVGVGLVPPGAPPPPLPPGMPDSIFRSRLVTAWRWKAKPRSGRGFPSCWEG
jgi:hypothetical protein